MYKIEKFEANLLKFLNDLENKTDHNLQKIELFVKNIQIQYQKIFSKEEKIEKNQEDKIFGERKKILNMY